MSNQTSKDVKELSKLTKEEWREYTKTVWHIANVTNPDHPATFPVEIPHRLIKLFTFWGETVLDPFAGTGTTGTAALRLGRSAILVEQNPEYARLAQQEISPLDQGGAQLQTIVADSRQLSMIDDDSMGLVVTSPPYWDKADYGPSESNLGNIEGYTNFVESLRPVFTECYRVLKPGRKLAVVTANVSQHTDFGLLSFPLSTDIMILLRSIGFVVINEVIWNKDGTGGRWGSWGKQRPIFGSYPYPPNFLFKTVHEYILIVAKPAATRTRGPKVKHLNELMMPHFAQSNGRTRDSNGH